MTTPQEILTELRDIHLPVVAETQTPWSLDPRPFVMLAVIVGLVGMIRYLRATQWRREARRRLREIAIISDPLKAQNALTALLNAVPARARLSQLPDSVFQAAGTPRKEDVEVLQNHVEAVLAGRAT